MASALLERLNRRPPVWPRFTNPVRSTAITARLGRLLGIAIGICFVTGLLSHYQYGPWQWLPEPASPVWGYRLTQGLHVLAGTAAIPLVLLKLWSAYPNLFQWPPITSVVKVLERLSILVLVATTLLQLVTGFLNSINWYAFPWFFTHVHYLLSYVVAGSVLLHIAVKLPVIVAALRTKVADGDVLTEEPTPESSSGAPVTTGPVDRRQPAGISRRGMLTAGGIGVGLVLVTSAGQSVTPLEPVGLLAIRQAGKGPQAVPVNGTADQAKVREAAMDADWALQVKGAQGYSLSLQEVEAMAAHESRFPLACVEGWSVAADWRGLSLLEVVQRAGGNADSTVRVHSLQKGGYNSSEIFGPQLSEALLATHLNGERLDVDHGYPLRLISPNRAGVLQTKWLDRIEVL